MFSRQRVNINLNGKGREGKREKSVSAFRVSAKRDSRDGNLFRFKNFLSPMVQKLMARSKFAIS